MTMYAGRLRPWGNRPPVINNDRCTILNLRFSSALPGVPYCALQTSEMHLQEQNVFSTAKTQSVYSCTQHLSLLLIMWFFFSSSTFFSPNQLSCVCSAGVPDLKWQIHTKLSSKLCLGSLSMEMKSWTDINNIAHYIYDITLTCVVIFIPSALDSVDQTMKLHSILTIWYYVTTGVRVLYCVGMINVCEDSLMSKGFVISTWIISSGIFRLTPVAHNLLK